MDILQAQFTAYGATIYSEVFLKYGQAEILKNATKCVFIMHNFSNLLTCNLCHALVSMHVLRHRDSSTYALAFVWDVGGPYVHPHPTPCETKLFSTDFFTLFQIKYVALDAEIWKYLCLPFRKFSGPTF